MQEPWNLKVDDTRLSDTLPTFIIFCEDEVSEPIYFKYFETSRIKVNPVGGQKSKMENVLKAIHHCISEDLMEFVGGVYKLKQEDTHVWSVFDRDKDNNDFGSTVFEKAIELAKTSGIKVAWSNDSFELWVLLHFDDIDPEDLTNTMRSAYYEKLSSIFKSLPEPNEDLQRAILHKSFNYKKDLKQGNNFRNIVRPTIIGNIREAIERAKKLEEYHSAEGKPNHEKSPCTLVHHLVLELLEFGGKEI
jgi:hypothetical protein